MEGVGDLYIDVAEAYAENGMYMYEEGEGGGGRWEVTCTLMWLKLMQKMLKLVSVFAPTVHFAFLPCILIF